MANSQVKKNKFIVPSSIAAAAALIAGGVFAPGFVQSTFSSWHDSDQVTGATITNGNLDIEADSATTGWYDVSTDVDSNPKKITAADFRMVPGDVIQYRAGFKVALEGDNLKARLTADNPFVSGDTVKTPHGVTATYALYKADSSGAPTGAALVKSEFVPGTGNFKPQDALDVNLTPESDGVTAKIEPGTQVNYVGVLELTFDGETPDRELVMDSTTVSEYSMSLTQVR